MQIHAASLGLLASLTPAALAQTNLQNLLAPGVDEVGLNEVAQLVTLADVDGDGSREIAFEVRTSTTRAIRVLSSGTGEALRTFPVLEGGFGTLAATDDLNGDGLPDFVVSEIENFGVSRLSAYSYRNGQRLWTIPGPEIGDRFGSQIVAAPDLDGDGVVELLVSAPSRDFVSPFVTFEDAGAVSVVSGADGTVLQTRVLGSGLLQSIGTSLDVLGDPDGDGRVEAVAGGYLSAGVVWEPLHTAPVVVLPDPSTQGAFGTPSSLTVAGFGGVGPDHFYIAVGDSDELANGPGQVTVYSAIDLLEAGIVTDPFAPFGALGFGHRVLDAGDMDGDGVEDLVVIDRPGSSSPAAEFQWFAYSGNFGFAVLGGDGSAETPFPVRGAKAGDLDGDGRGEVWFEGAFESPLGNGTVEFNAFELSAGEAPTLPLDQLDGLGGGSAVAFVPDRDGDGAVELLFGTPHVSHDGWPDVGRVTLLGALLPIWEQFGLPYEQFGAALCPLDDLDGDGIGEVLVGRPYALWNFLRRGAVSVLSGADGSVLREHGGSAAAGRFGAAVTRVPDADGDGVDDYAVGAPGHDANGIDAGRVRIFSGATGAQLAQVDGPLAGCFFGHALAGLDLDDDGAGDVLVGAPGAWTTIQAIGAGQVWRIDGTTGASLGVTTGAQAFEALGTSVAALGDVDGDGHADWIAGAPEYDELTPSDGRVEIRSGLDASLIRGHRGAFGEHLGAGVVNHGNADGDGIDDYAVGAPNAFDPTSAESFERVVVHSGTDGSILATYEYGPLFSPYDSETLQFTLFPVPSGFGTALAGRGDRDGDGLDDLAAGRPHFSVPATLAGGPSSWSTGAIGLWSPRLDGTAAIGVGTPGCAGPQTTSLLEVAKPGAPVLLRASGLAPGVVPVTVVGLAFAPGGEFAIPGLGALLHVDPTTLIVAQFEPPASGPSVDIALPTPNSEALIGLTLLAQHLSLWPTGCATTPAGWSSSTGVVFTVQ